MIARRHSGQRENRPLMGAIARSTLGSGMPEAKPFPANVGCEIKSPAGRPSARRWRVKTKPKCQCGHTKTAHLSDKINTAIYAAVREALERWGRHEDDCNIRKVYAVVVGFTNSCTCGLTAVQGGTA